MFKLDTKQLEDHIINELRPIKDMINLKEVNFIPNSIGSDEGLYVFSNQQGYHLVYSESGNETKHKITDSFFEITFGQ